MRSLFTEPIAVADDSRSGARIIFSILRPFLDIQKMAAVPPSWLPVELHIQIQRYGIAKDRTAPLKGLIPLQSVI